MKQLRAQHDTNGFYLFIYFFLSEEDMFCKEDCAAGFGAEAILFFTFGGGGISPHHSLDLSTSCWA